MQQQQSFDMTNTTPRVNSGLMGRFVGKRVKLVGQVAGINGSTVTLKAADQGTIEVHLSASAPTDQFVEFEGLVESPNVLREETHVGFGNSFGESWTETAML